MNDQTNPGEREPAAPGNTEVKFIFSRSLQFRRIQSSGAWFGVGPQKQIHLTFYSESPILPTLSIVTINSKGQPISQKDDIPPVGSFSREMEADVVLTLEAAKALHMLLGKNIELIDSQAQP